MKVSTRARTPVCLESLLVRWFPLFLTTGLLGPRDATGTPTKTPTDKSDQHPTDTPTHPSADTHTVTCKAIAPACTGAIEGGPIGSDSDTLS